VELCASARAVAPLLRHGRQAAVGALLARSTMSSFDTAWRLLPEDTRRLLMVACTYTSRQPPVVLMRNALVAHGWSPEQVDHEIDAARDRGMAGGTADELHVHQLVTDFVRTRSDSWLDAIRPALWREFVQVAKTFAERPNDIALRVQLFAHNGSLEAWVGCVRDGEASTIGDGLLEAGQFAVAQRWFEQAVKEKEQGDVHGRIDHESLGGSVHQVGACLSRQGEHAAAQAWFDRAARIRAGRGTD
jgi:hypothetical protein